MPLSSSPLFDAYLMVDWSAASGPKTGKDSIWFALAEWRDAGLWLSKLENPPTRWRARDMLACLLADLLAKGKRVLVGFDFPFGYPHGTARALGLAGMPWRAAWKTLAGCVSDDEKNRNNRFEVAGRLNQKIGHREGPFWGHPPQHKDRYICLKPAQPAYDFGLAEKRICERFITGPQPVWKLNGAGSVGGQTLTGLPVVHALRKDSRLRKRSRIWPFETDLKTLDMDDLKHQPVVFAEIYPSLVTPCSSSGQVKDALQVQAIAAYMAGLDKRQKLRELFAGALDLKPNERRSVEREEAWILGVSGPRSNSDAARVDVDGAFAGVD